MTIRREKNELNLSICVGGEMLSHSISLAIVLLYVLYCIVLCCILSVYVVCVLLIRCAAAFVIHVVKPNTVLMFFSVFTHMYTYSHSESDDFYALVKYLSKRNVPNIHSIQQRRKKRYFMRSIYGS